MPFAGDEGVVVAGVVVAGFADGVEVVLLRVQIGECVGRGMGVKIYRRAVFCWFCCES